MSKQSPSNHRLRTDEAYNLHLVTGRDCSEEWLMPEMQATYLEDLKGATELRSVLDPGQPEHVAHFFLDDYRFERYWASPEKYVDRLSQFGGVLTPDFSLYADMPVPMQIWNVYRSRALGHYWQDQGLTVVPTLQWATPDTYEFALRGLPAGGVYAVSTVGIRNDKAALHMFRMGLNYALEELAPEALLCYGTKDESLDFQGVKTIWSTTDSQRRIAESQARKNAA